MTLIKIPRGWEISENLVTDETDFKNRRKFIKQLGVLGLSTALFGCMDNKQNLNAQSIPKTPFKSPSANLFPATRNEKFKVARELTDEKIASRYNNFYEFTTDKDRVWKLAKDYKTRPWTVEITGEVKNKGTIDIDTLLKKLPMEERIYRFRCVEAWAMTVPWTGIPMKELIKFAEPTTKAKYVRFESFNNPDEAPGQKGLSWYKWPYYEGLTIEEANNELTLLGTGIYGKEMPMQHGAPIRLIVPWKYGFKSIKSIVKIEFTDEKPKTFWNDLAPKEYGFTANVNPKVPHPRWSQATERLIGSGERVPTKIYNGYEEFVKELYS